MTRLQITALVGFTGVLLGALGAHGSLHDHVAALDRLPQWETAVRYHLLHAAALLAAALVPAGETARRLRLSFTAWLIGILIFSGSLYVLASTGVKWLGAITPIGGLSLMLGWLGLWRVR